MPDVSGRRPGAWAARNGASIGSCLFPAAAATVVAVAVAVAASGPCPNTAWHSAADCAALQLAVADADGQRPAVQHLALPSAHAQGPGPADAPRIVAAVGTRNPLLLGAPNDVAVNATGHVFVAVAQYGRIEVFAPDGEHLHSVGRKGNGPGTLNRPEGIAVNATGHIFATDAGTSRLQVFHSGGAHAAVLAEPGRGRGQLNFPGGVAFDAAGRAYVADAGNSRVLVFNPDGTYLARIGHHGFQGGSLHLPAGVAVNPADGRIFVSDPPSDKIEVFGHNRQHVSTIQFPAGHQGHAALPYGLAVDPADGRLYAASLSGHRVVAYNHDGTYNSTLGGGLLNAPSGVAVSAAAGLVYVSDRGNDRVVVFDRAGSHVRTLGAGMHTEYELGYPSGAAAGPGGRLAVADTQNSRVLVYAANGTGSYTHSMTIGGRNASAGQLDSPAGVAFGPGGRIYVADQGNARLLAFGPAGGRADDVAANGTGPAGPLQSPADVAADPRSGLVAVADNGTIVLIGGGIDGGALRIGSRGDGPAQFKMPHGVALDRLGRILVADTFNGRVQVLEGDGSHLFDIRGSPEPGGGLLLPFGVASGPHGKIFVADSGRNRVQAFDHAGRFVTEFGRFGGGDGGDGDGGQLDSPRDVSVYPDGRVAVADSGNSRVQVFEQADPIPPRPLSVAMLREPSSGYLAAGDALEVAVRFTERVRIDASPSGDFPALLLNAAGAGTLSAPAAASYLSGNGTDTLAFSYTVRPGDEAPAADYASVEPFELGGSLVTGIDDGNLANLTMPARPGRPGSLASSGSPVIDAVHPAVLEVSSPGAAAPEGGAGAYGLGETVPIRVDFTEAVLLGSGPGRAAPSLELAAGAGHGRAAPYASGNGTRSLHFAYEVREGDRVSSLDYAGPDALSGAIEDAAGNAANLSLPEPGRAGSLAGENVSVFANRAPAIGPVAAQRTAEGVQLRVGVSASDPDGDAVTLSLARPHPEGAALRPGGVLEWTPRGGQAGSHTVTVSATDEYGLSAAAGIGIDVLALDDATPTVKAVRAPAADAGPDGGGGGDDPRPGYLVGQVIPVYVEFSQPVLVSTGGGTPYVELHAGSSGALALYHSGGAERGGMPGAGPPGAAPAAAAAAAGAASGPSVLEFRYVVKDGDVTARLSYAGAGALVLNGSSIESAEFAGVRASTHLPPPGSAGSLSAPPPGQLPASISTTRAVLDVGVLDEAGPAGPIAAAAHLAAAEFNLRQAASVDGSRFLMRVHVHDAGTTPASAAAALRSAHSGPAGPSVYVGPSTDRGLHAAMPYAAMHGLVLVSAGSTAPSLAVAGDRTFRLLPSDGLQANALARIASSAGAASIYAVIENASYGPAAAGRPDMPPPPGRFSHGFGAALADSAVPSLGGTVILGGAGAEGGGGDLPDGAAAAAAAAALGAAVRSGDYPAAVVYLGSPDGLAALAGHAAAYSDLRSALWFASDLSAGSGLLAGDAATGPAAGFAAQVGLTAVQWLPPENALARGIGLRLANGTPGASLHGAYAAYDAVTLLGAAAADAGRTDAAGIAGRMHAAASSYEGALGDIVLDPAGDLWSPARYGVWEVAAQAGQGGAGDAAPRWIRQQDVSEARACSIRLGTGSLNFGSVTPGQYTRSIGQAVINSGQLPLADVELIATPWYAGSDGLCREGSHPSLPVGLSEIRSSRGGAFAPLTAGGTTVGGGLEPGGEVPLWYRINLTGYADFPRTLMVQCVTYMAEC